MIETCGRAEELGCDACLIAEHHFREYGAVPDPVAMLAALAAHPARPGYAMGRRIMSIPYATLERSMTLASEALARRGR